MTCAVLSACPALLPLSLIPSLGEWLIIGVFGSFLFSRWFKLGPAGKAVQAALREQPRTRESSLDRIRQRQVPICVAIGAICLLISFDLLKEARYGQGLMLLLCAIAAGMVAFAVHQR